MLGGVSSGKVSKEKWRGEKSGEENVIKNINT